MRELKDLAVTIMYIYTFVIVLSERNIIAITILIILGWYLLSVNIKLRAFESTLKRQLNTQRENFINALNHDLRIPIIAQIRALELIRNQKLGELNPAQKDIVVQIEQSCKYILNLTSLMINTYRMENNSYKLIYERFNISEVIVSCFDELLPIASEKNITFEYNSENKNINITADKEELKKVILNILSSLITNAYIGEKVSVILSSLHDKIRLTICGNNKNQFYANLENSSCYTSVGQAIRMGFCKKIIETHNGKVVENTEKNSFSFELPLFRAA